MKFLQHTWPSIVIVLACSSGVYSAGETIEFRDGHSPPPTIPTVCSERKYNLPVNRVHSFPLQAFLKNSTNHVISGGPDSGASFTIASLDAANKDDPTYDDPWISSGGKFCRWAMLGQFPRRMQRQYYSPFCSDHPGKNVLTGYVADEGELYVHGLRHEHPSSIVPSGNRIYRITLTLSDGNTVTADSNEFEVTEEAAELRIFSEPPASVVAGDFFSVGVEAVNHNGEVLTVGADACNFIELGVPMYKDVQAMFAVESKLNILFYEKIRMRGPDVWQRKGGLNYVIRKPLTDGKVTFQNVQILDVTPGVKLNATAFMPTFPYIRRPDDYADLAGIVVEADPMMHYYQDPNYQLSKAIALTQSIQVTEQIATQIVILNKGSMKTKHTVNFNIEGIIIEARDATGNRIYSGRDSALNVAVSITPSTDCLSVDADFTLVEGQGAFPGSICEPTSSVTLTFEANSIISGSAVTPDTSPSMEVKDEIHMASILATEVAGSDNWVDSHVDAFAHFAVDDINDGFHNLLAGRKLVLDSFDHKYSTTRAVDFYRTISQIGKDDPSKKTQAVMGFASNELTSKLQPLLTVDKIPQMGVREDKFEFQDKGLYPYYNRICWTQGATTHSIMLTFKSRGWTRICVVKSTDVELGKVFYSKAQELGITLIEVNVPELDLTEYDNIGNMKDIMDKVKDTGTVIVWIFLMAPLYWKFIREGYVAGVSPVQGYQWITSGIYGWQQPFLNQIPLCKLEPICTVILRGAYLFGYTYNLQGLRTPWWRRTLVKHITKDTYYLPGTVPKHTMKLVTSEFAQSYDGIMLLAKAMDSFVTEQKTITGPALAEKVREITFWGLTGEIIMDENGNRKGSIVFTVICDPQPPKYGTPAIKVLMWKSEMYLEYDGADTQLELRMQVQWPMALIKDFGPLYPFVLPNTTFINRVKFNTSDGMLSPFETIVPIPGCETFDPPGCKEAGSTAMWVELEEHAPAPFFCKQGCGTEQPNPYDINQYNFGTCISMGVCDCEEGYRGDDCTEMICLCTNGRCDVPEVCICDPGWTGEKCSIAICSNPCAHGRCTSPDVCTCDSGYVGSTCSSSLAVVVTLPVLAVIGLILGAVFFGRWFLKRQARQQALANLDWRCIWDEEVQTGVEAISMVSTAAEDLMSKKNYVTWKSARCYAQKYNCDTLDVNNLDLRMQVVQVKELRNNNIIQFIGACLEWPNVCILTEPCPKGSLEDLLANDNIKLSWDFKYSLLKDICRGMEYLHRSEIHSHGRLKSTNCLVDNRWTCKITGFGLPSIRYAAPRKERPDKEEGQVAERNLFWTAPELLVDGVNTLDKVGKGTQAGDVYSFAVVMSEVITREEPYCQEMMNLLAEDVIMLVKDKDAPSAAKAKRKWYEAGGDTTKQLRPKIDDSYLPDEYAAKNGLRKLCDTNWSGSVDMRLSFRQSLEKLNEIHPIKGELIDNLINMLEKYSSNLESIVAERTKELQIEKAKTEQLVSQMLPKKVVEDLKHGRTVEPETFECVTIFFSDLVGFTSIAKNSTPLQVVDLLNDLYTTFDSILDTYDVYKVETIGDAYMVVSGLPIRNGDLHAGEIATMSLDLLASMTTFKIRHMPGTCLQLRIGMHSGSCVAGVVGLKMPRYCLFGDTVNTASRMESSSMALRIHMSEHTANILFKLGGYHLDCRGEREVKGKGTMTTYWLEGKDGFTKQLPGKEMAVSASQHEFK